MGEIKDAQNYEVAEIEEMGHFRCRPIRWEMEEYDSGSACIFYRMAVVQKWSDGDETWTQEYPPGYYVDHRAWVVSKRDEKGRSKLNEKTLASLAKCGIFDGEFDRINSEPPPQEVVIAQVDEDQYEGRVRYRANWVNPNSDRPEIRGSGGYRPTDSSMLERIKRDFQSQARAIASSATGSNRPKPQGQPAPPPTPPVPPRPPQSNAPPSPSPRESTGGDAAGGGGGAPEPPAPPSPPPEPAPPTARAAPSPPPPPAPPPPPHPGRPPDGGASYDPDDPPDPDETPF